MNCPRCGCELDDMSPTCPGCLAEPPLAPATGSVKCAVQLCGGTAVCELAVEGKWFPICAAHSVNRVLPRRRLSPNNKVSHE